MEIKFNCVILDRDGVKCGEFNEWLDKDGWKHDYFHEIVADGVFELSMLGDGFLGRVVRRQFIGHQDIEGKDIFVGDKLTVAGRITYVVDFLTQDEDEEKIAAFGLRRDDNTFFAIDHFAIKHGIVIGNIYE